MGNAGGVADPGDPCRTSVAQPPKPLVAERPRQAAGGPEGGQRSRRDPHSRPQMRIAGRRAIGRNRNADCATTRAGSQSSAGGQNPFRVSHLQSSML